MAAAGADLAGLVAAVIQSPHKPHHDAHTVLWTRIEHLHLRVVERVAWIGNPIPSLP